MTIESHPFTLIDPECGRPAFHAKRRPSSGDPITAKHYELVDGSIPVNGSTMICGSCGRRLAPMGKDKDLVLAIHWAKRIK